MSEVKPFRILSLFGVILTAAVLAGCGSDSTNDPASTPGAFGNRTGLQPSGNGTCVPLTGALGFQGDNIYMDSSNLIGGQLPAGDASWTWGIGNAGTVSIGSGGAGGGQLSGSSSYGSTVSMQVTQLQGNRANISGTIAISQQELQTALPAFLFTPFVQPGQFAGGTVPSYNNICASGIAFNMGVSNIQLWDRVYIYLLNTSEPMTVIFDRQGGGYYDTGYPY